MVVIHGFRYLIIGQEFGRSWTVVLRKANPPLLRRPRLQPEKKRQGNATSQSAKVLAGARRQHANCSHGATRGTTTLACRSLRE